MAGSAAGDSAITETSGLSATAISDSVATSRPTDINITDIFVMNRLGIDMIPPGTDTDRIHIATDTLVTAIDAKPRDFYGIADCRRPRAV